MHLEQQLTKQQIFEYYANQVYLGRRGTFSIHGFGEAARAYFAKDLSQITTAGGGAAGRNGAAAELSTIRTAIPTAPASGAIWCSS